MWGFGKRELETRAASIDVGAEGVETRAADIDVGSVYASIFGFQGGSYAFTISPAVLAGSLASPGNAATLAVESRRLSRVSPLFVAYVANMRRNIVCAEPEAPMFSDRVPERTAAAAVELWMRHHDVDVERDRLRRVIVDGEFLLIGDDATNLNLIPSDGFEAVETGPDWKKVVTAYRVGKGSAARRESETLIYVGDRVEGEPRAWPWTASALPYAAALTSIRVAASHGLAALAKLAAYIENTTPDRITAQPAGRSGVVAPDRNAGSSTAEQPITAVGVGSVPFMRMHEAIKRVQAGPDETARKYEGELERDVASALNIPLVELRGDFSSGGSFSNLRMAWADAQAEYADRRAWWHRAYRIPVWRRLLDAAWMAGDMPRMSREVLAALRMPTWAGPTPPGPAPEKDALTAKLLVEAGIITAEQAEQLARVSL